VLAPCRYGPSRPSFSPFHIHGFLCWPFLFRIMVFPIFNCIVSKHAWHLRQWCKNALFCGFWFGTLQYTHGKAVGIKGVSVNSSLILFYPSRRLSNRPKTFFEGGLVYIKTVWIRWCLCTKCFRLSLRRRWLNHNPCKTFRYPVKHHAASCQYHLRTIFLITTS